MSPIRAVLLDLGGPVLNEDAEYASWDDSLVQALRTDGVPVGSGEFRRVVHQAVRSCDSNPWLSALWHFTQPDLVRFARLRQAFRVHAQAFLEDPEGVFVRDEAKRTIPELALAYKLALAGNQPATVLRLLEDAELLRHFHWPYVSEQMGVAKPVPLFFRMILDGLGVEAQEAVMVGDRLDHDVFPARLVGMRTVRVLVGPYAKQEPPSPLHVPHATVQSLAELPVRLKTLEQD